MQLTYLMKRTNDLLAGEQLTFDQLKPHFDSVIDEINSNLNAYYPSFSEFQEAQYEGTYDYDYIPDKYLRSVVAIGAAYYFYLTDEEGAESATEFGRKYYQNLFYMQRDHQVEEEYWAGDRGSLYTPEPQGLPRYIDDMF